MAQRPPKKRIQPVLIAAHGAAGGPLQPTSAADLSAPEAGPLEYHQGPSSLPGRRIWADISVAYIIDYKQLLRQNGVNPKVLKASKAAAKPGKAPGGLPPLPGFTRTGGSPGGKSMYGSVVERLERIYAGGGRGDDDEDSDDEGESEDDGESSEAEASGSSSSDADEEDEGEPGGGTATERGESGTEATVGEGGAAGAGVGSDGGVAAAGGVAKKQRRRREDMYEDDFIDDDEEIRYERARQVKTKYQGFWINQGPIQVEEGPEPGPEERPGATKKAPRPRPAANALPPRPKGTQAPAAGAGGEAPGAGGAPASAAAPAGAAAAVGGTGGAGAGLAEQGPGGGVGGGSGAAAAVGGGAAGTPVKAPKRRAVAEADGQQPQPVAAKKRKQTANQQEPGGNHPQPAATQSQQQPGPATTAGGPEGSGPAGAARPAAGGMAALAAAAGRTAAAAGRPLDVGAQAADGHAAGKATAPAAAASTAPDTAPPAAAPAAAVTQPAAAAPTRGAGGRRAAAAAAAANATASLEPFIADCRKKLAAAASPPEDWRQLLKAIESPLTQLALYLHRNHPLPTDPARDAALTQLAAGLAVDAPSVIGSCTTSTAVEELANAVQKRVERNVTQLASMVVGLHKLAAEAVAAEAAAAAAAPNGLTANGAHSSDDEFSEPPPAGAAPATCPALELLEAKLRSYLNLKAKLHGGTEEDEVMRSLAAQIGVDVSLLRRATVLSTTRPAAERKRQVTKTAAAAVANAAANAAAALTEGITLKQQAAAIAAEVQRAAAGDALSSGLSGPTAAGCVTLGAAAATGPPTARGAAAGGGGVAGASQGQLTALVPGGIGSLTAAASLAAAAAVPMWGTPPRSGRPREMDAVAEGVAGDASQGLGSGLGSQPLDMGRGGEEAAEGQHQFPSPELDRLQRDRCRTLVRDLPTAREDWLEAAFAAAGSSSWAALVIKVLCHQPKGLKCSEMGKLAREQGYIIWPSNKPAADLNRSLHQNIARPTISQHVIHVGNHKYMLRALDPEMAAVPRPPSGRAAAGVGAGGAPGGVGEGGGMSGGSSPIPVPPPGVGGGSAFGPAAVGPAEPFPLLDMLAGAIGVVGVGGGVASTTAAGTTAAGGGRPGSQPSGPLRSGPGDEDVGAGAGGGAVAAAGGGEEESVVISPEEEEQQSVEAVEAASSHGANSQQVREALSSVRGRNPRAVFKVLCHAGPTGMKVSDIVRTAIERRFAGWRNTAQRSVHSVLRNNSSLMVHVGGHRYALALLPGVVAVVKPGEGRRAGKEGAGGGAGGVGAAPGGDVDQQGLEA